MSPEQALRAPLELLTAEYDKQNAKDEEPGSEAIGVEEVDPLDPAVLYR